MIAPLAERIRPKVIDQYVGQQHLVGPQGAIRPILKTGQLPSLILCGPPGTGKTSLIKAISNYLNCHIVILSLKLNKTKKQLKENKRNTN